MHPPDDLVQRPGGIEFHAREGPRQKPAHERPDFPGGIGDVNAQRLGDESGYNDGADQQQHDYVVGRGVQSAAVSQTIGLFNEAAVERDDHTDQHEQPEKIHQEGKD